MAMAAHIKGGAGGVSQAVGKEFNQADKGTGILSKTAKRYGAKKNDKMD